MAFMTSPATSYETLSPDMVLDALDSVGLRGDGRLLALNSYENRVYQVAMEEGAPVVAKFYRPGRWSDAQILEEHAFVAELVEREIPVVPAMTLDGGTLQHFGGFSFAVSGRTMPLTVDSSSSRASTIKRSVPAPETRRRGSTSRWRSPRATR